MKKESQDASMKWVEDVESWESEKREKASRRFFQVWNIARGTKKTDSRIKPDVPLRCTVWRSSVRKFDEILQDLILRDKEGLMDTFIRGLEQIYPELEAQAKTNPQLQQKLLDVDAFLGKGRYEHEGLKTKLLHKQEVELEKTRERKGSPSETVIHDFYEGLKPFPNLQKKYLEAVTDIKFIDIEGKLGRGTGGHHTGTTSIQGVQRPNKLLTFFLMKDPYPYLRAAVTNEIIAELAKKFPNGNQPEDPVKDVPAGTKKTYADVAGYTPPGGAKIYVQNPKNPNYDFVTVNSQEAMKQDETKKKIQEKVTELQKESMFNNAYLANNVLQNSPAFADKKQNPGIGVMHLGSEQSYDINDEERDMTKLDKGGLFWIPEKGLPKEEVVKEKLPKEKPTFVWKETEAQLPPSRNLFSRSIEVVLGQLVDMQDMWFDDEGNEYDSMEQVEAKYQQDAINEGTANLKEKVKDILKGILSQGPKLAPAPAPVLEKPEVEPVEVPEEKEEELADIIQMPQEEEEKELELSLAAKHVIRLVRIANLLDKKGFSQEADLIDNIVRDIISTQ